jgi:hypothetical protein
MSDPLTPEEIDAFAKALGIEPEQVGDAAAEPVRATGHPRLAGTRYEGMAGVTLDDVVDQIYWMSDETIQEFFGDSMFGIAQGIGSDIAPAIAQIMQAIQSQDGLTLMDLDRCIRRLAVVVTASTVNAIREDFLPYMIEPPYDEEDPLDEDEDDW